MKSYSLFYYLLSFVWIVESYYVTLSQNGPVVIGGTISLTAELYQNDGERPSGSYKFSWQDNAIPKHSDEFEGQFTKSVWNITYPADKYSPGTYEVEVKVGKEIALIHWNIASERININVTVLLNGEIQLIQNGTALDSNDVSNAIEVVHKVVLNQADDETVRSRGMEMKTYWFKDCRYMGMSSDGTLAINYTKGVEGDHSVKALVMVEPPPQTTTILPTTPTTSPTTTTTLTKVPLKGGGQISSNDVGGTLHLSSLTSPPTTSILSTIPTTHAPPNCPNSTFIPTDPQKTYGYFHRTVSVKSPVESVTVNGPNWLLHGDVLNLTVTCTGSSPYYHCVRIITGAYNATGTETCVKPIPSKECLFSALRYFSTPQTYTLLFIINNSVSHTVTPFGVNIYEVQKHAQLSVIVVPISFSVVAVVLIVFGVAYYIQSRSRYMVEVADFDFSQGGGNETEYKTFRERLREAVSGALTRGGSDYSDEGPAVWSPSRKYGSMQ